MLIPLIRTRIVQSLEGTPKVLPLLIAGISEQDARWDHSFAPDRFTLREVFAHLVDYDGVWNIYLDHALSANEPVAVQSAYTPDSVAEKRDYSATDPQASLRDFAAGRASLVARLHALDADDWAARGVILASGAELNIDALASLFLAHDGYHARQIAEYASSDLNSQ